MANETATPSTDQFLNELVSMKAREADIWTDQALSSVRAARKELDDIEAQLRLAYENEPYRRIGRIDGVNAQTVFNAFSAIETLAQLRSIKERTNVPASGTCERAPQSSPVGDPMGSEWCVTHEAMFPTDMPTCEAA